MAWFYQYGGQAVGPVSSNDLQRLAADGVVGPDTPVRPESRETWSVAEKIQGLVFQKNIGPSAPIRPVLSEPSQPVLPQQVPPMFQTESTPVKRESIFSRICYALIQLLAIFLLIGMVVSDLPSGLSQGLFAVGLLLLLIYDKLNQISKKLR